MEWLAQPGTLVPCIVQDELTAQVLMLGYMNEEAFAKTLETQKVTFFSRSKQRLWTKGESSKNYLNLKSLCFDCDQDTILALASPDGPTCHLQRTSCFNEPPPSLSQLGLLERTIDQRRENANSESYTQSLFQKGLLKIAQKVGEEAVEVALASTTENKTEVLEEASDLLYHLEVLLRAQNLSIKDVANTLRKRSETV